jgi:uncharacterized membrane protein
MSAEIMSGELQTFFLAMAPVGELRAAIPVALTVYRLNWFWAYFLSVIGNLVPAFFILLFFPKVADWLSRRIKIFNRFFVWLFARTQKKYQRAIEKYGPLALFIFVAVPLPGTGAWTAALIAFLFGISFKKALPMIVLGVMAAGLLVLALSGAGIMLFSS